jgi:pimeloyl-ACP methyl ester carboxylesterase
MRVPAGDLLEGVATLAVKIVVDRDRIDDRPIVLCCFSGGGMSSRYFELDGFDMAGYLAEAGLALVLIDHPAIGASDAPDDPWLLSPETVAAVEVVAVRYAVARLGLHEPVVIGVGHSMGAMLVAYQQNRGHLYAGLALIGYSGRGLPEVLAPWELAIGDDADRVRASSVELARRRFHVPLPVADHASSDQMLVGPGLPADASAALAEANGPLLAVCGLTTLLPGAHTRELASLDVPLLLSVAENDIVGPPDELPGYFPASPAVALQIVPDAHHNSNVAPTRHLLWDRIAHWARTVPGRET